MEGKQENIVSSNTNKEEKKQAMNVEFVESSKKRKRNQLKGPSGYGLKP